MKPLTKKLRDAVKHIEDSWVRVWPDGTIQAGVWSKRSGQSRGGQYLDEMVEALEAAGFRCELNGEPLLMTST